MDIFERSKLRIDAPSVFFVDDCLEEVLEALDQLLEIYFFWKIFAINAIGSISKNIRGVNKIYINKVMIVTGPVNSK